MKEKIRIFIILCELCGSNSTEYLFIKQTQCLSKAMPIYTSKNQKPGEEIFLQYIQVIYTRDIIFTA